MRTRPLGAAAVLAAATLALAACGDGDTTDTSQDTTPAGDSSPSSEDTASATEAPADDATTTSAAPDAGRSTSAAPEADGGVEYPLTIEHALGTITLEEEPERVATVAWANHEVPLALGVVPVGMAEANFGDEDGDGLLPWVAEELDELGAETPVLFDETDGIDFEAVAGTDPDVILAAYSGLTQEEYDTLSQIAPVMAFPDNAWGTPWRDMIRYNSLAMGMGPEGEQLITDLDDDIAEAAAEHPALQGKSAMFMTHIDPTNIAEVGYYTTHDTRVQFFEDLGLAQPQSILDASAETDSFALTQSVEQIDVFDDVDIVVTYGSPEGDLATRLAEDPLVQQMPAIANGAILELPDGTALSTAANPTPLAIDWILEDYLDALDTAAAASEGQ